MLINQISNQNMEGRKPNLHLPYAFKERPKSERPSSRTDRFVENYFTCDTVPEALPFPSTSSYKALPSTGKLKALLSKTSDKLKGLQGKTDSLNSSHQDFVDKAELARLRREVKILEMEK